MRPPDNTQRCPRLETEGTAMVHHADGTDTMVADTRHGWRWWIPSRWQLLAGAVVGIAAHALQVPR